MYMSRSTQLQAPKKAATVNTAQQYANILERDKWGNNEYGVGGWRSVDEYAYAVLHDKFPVYDWSKWGIRVDAANRYTAAKQSDAATNAANEQKYQRDVAEYNSWKESTAFVADARARELASRNASNPGAPTSRASLLGMGTNMLTEAQRQASVLGAHNALEEQKRQKTLLSKGW